jgi:hypothetical protein
VRLPFWESHPLDDFLIDLPPAKQKSTAEWWRLLPRGRMYEAMNFYMAAVAIGLGIAVAWITWLLVVRTFLRRTNSRPGVLLSILQVIIVLLLMQIAWRLSDRYFDFANITSPDAMKTFRRIWILTFGAGMVASIQLFLDIRKMAEPMPASRPASPMNRPRRRRR